MRPAAERGPPPRRGRPAIPLAWRGVRGYIPCMMIFLIVVAMLITLGVLFTGLISMARGGEFNRKYGNKLMRLRVIAQGVAILLFGLAIMIGNGGQ